MVLSIRNLHLLHRDGALPAAAQAYFEVLEPGGTLGIVQHRAPEGSDRMTLRFGRPLDD